MPKIRLVIGLFVAVGIALAIWFGSTFIVTTTTTIDQDQVITPSSEIIDATLREFDNQGNLLWEIQAKRGEYRQDRRIADIVDVNGKFFDAGKLVLEARGKTGIINQTTQEISIEGQVKGKVLKEEIDIICDNLEWSSPKDLIQATGNITFSQPKDGITVKGEKLEGKVSQNTYTLKRKVVVTTTKPAIEINSEAITWNVESQKIISEAPITARQAKENRQLTADRGTWDTKNQIVELLGKVQGQDNAMDVTVTTDKLLWNLLEQKVTLPDSFVVASASRGLRITAQTGIALFTDQRINLLGEVQAELQTDQATVSADRVNWEIPSQTVTADGGVRYNRRANNLRVQGDQAVANLELQTVQVTGANVISEFTP